MSELSFYGPHSTLSKCQTLVSYFFNCFYYRKDAFVPCSTSQLEILQAAQFDDHNSTVWRISWNITGTILASTGDDGCVRMWKGNS